MKIRVANEWEDEYLSEEIKEELQQDLIGTATFHKEGNQMVT